MVAQWVIGIVLAIAAVLLLARDLRRAGRDPLRRPTTMLAGALVVVLLAGTFGGRTLPNPWWLALPAAILAWEAVRGWRRSPRCHLREGGIAAWAAGLALAAAGLGFGGAAASPLVLAAAVACAAGTALMWRSHQREPRPWREGDREHYERRDVPRP